MLDSGTKGVVVEVEVEVEAEAEAEVKNTLRLQQL